MRKLNPLIRLVLIILFNSQILCNQAKLDKWIVVTTINYPSASLKKLATLEGWHLVVVGDRKTPKDWHLDHCEFLSIEKQKALDYEIIKFLPENHYCRKNIGYLYAISHGAKLIYETDDDNELIDCIISLPDENELVEVSVKDQNSVNIFAYFGEQKVWPRGFPLNQIANSNNYQTKNAVKKTYGITQGLINKDTDVDAIFRLTQYRDIYFQQKTACILPIGTFCPFNTQNTIFHYDAFWGLMIPATTSFRVCDIWRSYITQRLLWDLDLHLCFTSPTAIQDRNAHDLFKDFCEEQDLYLKSGQLIQFLLNWKNESACISQRLEILIQELVLAKYFKKAEIDLAQAWISDLKKLGYQFPKLKKDR